MKELLELLKSGKPQEAKELLLKNNEKIDLNYSDKEGRTALIISCEKGYDEFTELLLENGALPDFVPEPISSPRLVRCKAIPCLSEYTYADWENYEYQQRLDRTDGVYYKEETPLIIVIIKNNIKSVESLLKHNADIFKCDATKKLPIYFAAMNCNREILALLINQKIKQNQDSLNQALVAVSINKYIDTFDYVKFIEFLLENGADINYKVSDSESILTCLINTRKFKEARYLISRGALVYEEVILALVKTFPIKCEYFDDSDNNEEYKNLLLDSRIEYFLKNTQRKNDIIEKAIIRANVEMLRILIAIGFTPNETFLCKTLKQLEINQFSRDIFIDNKISIELIKNGYLNNFSERLLDCKKIMGTNIQEIIKELLILIDNKIELNKEDKELIEIREFFLNKFFKIIKNKLNDPQRTPQSIAKNVLALKNLIRKIKSEIMEDTIKNKTCLPDELNKIIIQYINNKSFKNSNLNPPFKILASSYIEELKLNTKKRPRSQSMDNLLNKGVRCEFTGRLY